MAHKKGLGSSKNGRDSNPKYLGVKMFDGQAAQPGNIIVRQRGTRFRPGPGTLLGRDDTIFAVRAGTWKFITAGAARYGANPPPKNPAQPQLYDLSTDLTEQKNLAADQPAKLQEMAVEIEERAALAVLLGEDLEAVRRTDEGVIAQASRKRWNIASSSRWIGAEGFGLGSPSTVDGREKLGPRPGVRLELGERSLRPRTRLVREIFVGPLK